VLTSCGLALRDRIVTQPMRYTGRWPGDLKKSADNVVVYRKTRILFTIISKKNNNASGCSGRTQPRDVSRFPSPAEILQIGAQYQISTCARSISVSRG